MRRPPRVLAIAATAAVAASLASSVTVTGCGPAATPTSHSPGYRTDTLEAELGRLPSDLSPSSTIQRSRLLRALGRQPEAVSQLEASLEAARQVLDWRGMSAAWRELGDVQIELARPQDALDTYAKRLTNAKSLDITRERAFAQVDLAYAFVHLSQWTPAQNALEDAEVLARSELETDAETLEKMAFVREKLLAREIAIDLFDRARALHARNGDATGEARAAIARAYLLAIDQESSAPMQPSLDELAARARDPEVRARLLRYRGEVAYLFDRQYPRCLELAEEGRPLAERRGIRQLAKTLNILASVCAARLGNLAQAISTAETAVAYSEDEWQNTAVPSARQAVGFEALLLYRHILGLDVKLPDAERVPAAFAAMEKARGRAHIDAAVRGGANLVSSGVEIPPLLARDKQEIEAHIAQINKQIYASKNDPIQLQRRRDALWALDDVKSAIAFRNPLITRLQAPRPANLARARELLDDKSMLLSYLVMNDQVIAIAVTKTTERLFVVEGGAATLATEITRFRDEALIDPEVPMDLVKSDASALFKKLVAPVKDLVRAHERLIILPHGALSTLPFEALVDGNGEFLVERHVVTYSQSATLALEDARAKPGATNRRPFVGIGDPVYDWVSFKAGRPEGVPSASRGMQRYLDARPTLASAASKTKKPRRASRTGLERLLGTAREIKTITPLFGSDAKMYMRDQASEENVKAGILAGARIIHVASHGLFETDYQALVLTVRPDGKDDGFLMQSEIAELKLDADIMVMSACETGRAHEVLAEPVSGLALAVRTAGVRRMVVSLWEVDDFATVELMKLFYQPVVKGNAPYGVALTEAKRKLMATKKWEHPFYWAPFVLVGN